MKQVGADALQPWQPLTPRGVARFIAASWARLTVVLLIFALLGGTSTTVFLASAWFPTIRNATRALPEEGYIRGGRLAWTGEPTVILAQSRWLGLTIDLHQEHAQRLPSDLQVEFSEGSVRVISFARCTDLPYPKGWIIAFNEPELSAWWNAWEPFLAAGAGAGTVIGLLGIWAVLAAVYSLPAAAVCRFVGHRVPWKGVFKLCIAAQMPGCLLMSFTLLLYSVRAIDMVQWLFVVAAHFVASWLYVGLAVFFIRDRNTPRRRPGNPFKTS